MTSTGTLSKKADQMATTILNTTNIFPPKKIPSSFDFILFVILPNYGY
jgi:hypothetical protein